MEEEELVVLTLSNEEQDFERVIVYPEMEGFDTLELLVGDDITYLVDIKLIEDENKLMLIMKDGVIYKNTL